MIRGHLHWCRFIEHHDCCNNTDELLDCDCGGPWVSVRDLEERATFGFKPGDGIFGTGDGKVVSLNSVNEILEKQP